MSAAAGLMSGPQVERFAAGKPMEFVGVAGAWRLVKVIRGHIPQGMYWFAGPSRKLEGGPPGEWYMVQLYDPGVSDGLDAIDMPQIPDEGLHPIALCQVEPA